MLNKKWKKTLSEKGLAIMANIKACYLVVLDYILVLPLMGCVTWRQFLGISALDSSAVQNPRVLIKLKQLIPVKVSEECPAQSECTENVLALVICKVFQIGTNVKPGSNKVATPGVVIYVHVNWSVWDYNSLWIFLILFLANSHIFSYSININTKERSLILNCSLPLQ